MPANALRPKDAYLHPPGIPAGMPTPAGWWADIADSPKCREALQVAFMEMVMQLEVGNLQDAANNGVMIQGVKRYVKILLNLGIPDLPSVRPETQQLQPV